jgi:hypothetical protein
VLLLLKRGKRAVSARAATPGRKVRPRSFSSIFHTLEQWGYDKLMTALRETLSADEIAQLTAGGAAWSEDQAVEEAPR